MYIKSIRILCTKNKNKVLQTKIAYKFTSKLNFTYKEWLNIFDLSFHKATSIAVDSNILIHFKIM